MFEPCFFDKNRLFGIYHPAPEVGSDRLLVVCPPLFDEYRRSYRALSELAKGCAAGGSHVFRFDYYGTGESWGDLEEATVENWLDDIRAAIEEGASLSGANKIYLLGVRFGATLAAQIHHPDIVAYIFWDPLPSGEAYLAHLARVDAELKSRNRTFAQRLNIPVEPVDYQMFPVSPSMRDGMARLSVDFPALGARAKLHRIVCQESQAIDGAEYGGIPYDWPISQRGVIGPKPVLEAIASKLT